MIRHWAHDTNCIVKRLLGKLTHPKAEPVRVFLLIKVEHIHGGVLEDVMVEDGEGRVKCVGYKKQLYKTPATCQRKDVFGSHLHNHSIPEEAVELRTPSILPKKKLSFICP